MLLEEIEGIFIWQAYRYERTVLKSYPEIITVVMIELRVIIHILLTFTDFNLETV